jgi:hypothetical protein
MQPGASDDIHAHVARKRPAWPTQPGGRASRAPHTPRARGWRPRARGRRSGRHAAWMGTMARGQPPPGLRRVARRLRPAGAGARRMATHRGGWPTRPYTTIRVMTCTGAARHYQPKSGSDVLWLASGLSRG